MGLCPIKNEIEVRLCVLHQTKRKDNQMAFEDKLEVVIAMTTKMTELKKNKEGGKIRPRVAGGVTEDFEKQYPHYFSVILRSMSTHEFPWLGPWL